MLLDELLGLHEHATRTAAWVVNTPLVWCEHLDEQVDYAAGCVELSSLLAFGAGELCQGIFVHATEDIFRAILLVAQTNVTDQVDELAEALLVQAWASVVLRQHPFEREVITLDSHHRIIDQ